MRASRRILLLLVLAACCAVGAAPAEHHLLGRFRVNSAQPSALVSVAAVFKRGQLFADTLQTTTGHRAKILSRWPSDNSIKHVLVVGELPAGKDIGFEAGGNGAPHLTPADIARAAPRARVTWDGEVFDLADLLATPVRTYYSSPDAVEAHYQKWVGKRYVAFYVRHTPVKTAVQVLVSKPIINRAKSTSTEKPERLVVEVGDRTLHDGDATIHLNAAWIFEGFAIGEQAPYTLWHDVDAMVEAGFFPDYGLSRGVSDAVLDRLYRHYVPGTMGNNRSYMPSSGYHGSIGNLPAWWVAYLRSHADPRAFESVTANDRAALAHAVSFRRADGEVMNPNDNPNGSYTANGGGTNDLRNGKYVSDSAHHPLLGWSYVLTGEQIYKDLLEGSLMSFYQRQWTADGKGSAKIVKRYSQLRGTAWFYRTAGAVCGILPDDSANLPVYREWLHNNVVYALSRSTRDPAVGPKGGLGFPFAHTSKRNGIRRVSPWQYDFWSAAVGWTSDLEPLAGQQMDDFIELRSYLYRGAVERAGLHGLCIENAAPYFMTILPAGVTTEGEHPAREMYRSWRELQADVFGDGDCVGTLAQSGKGYPVKEAATTHLGNWYAALQFAAKHRAEDAMQALAAFHAAPDFGEFRRAAWATSPFAVQFVSDPVIGR